MKLLIDNRETKIKEYFQVNNCIENVEYTNLDIGDFIYKNGDTIEYLIERKTLHDTLQSIKDGRYKEQKMRILDHVSKDRLLYIIEDFEKINTFDEKSKNMIYGFLLNSMLRDGIHILCTINIDQTIDIIKRIYFKIHDPATSILNNIGNNIGNYVSTLKIKKKDNMTPERCFLIQLCQIPGVSTTLAGAIVEKYPSFISLYTDFLKHSNPIFLENIEISSSKKNRKLGKKTAFKVCEYLQFPMK
jgi:ERCC4-type nuclease